MPVSTLSAAAQRVALASMSGRPSVARLATRGVAGLAKPAPIAARRAAGPVRGLAVKASMVC